MELSETDIGDADKTDELAVEADELDKSPKSKLVYIIASVIIVILVMIGVGSFVYWYVRKRKQSFTLPPASPPPPPPPPPVLPVPPPAPPTLNKYLYSGTSWDGFYDRYDAEKDVYYSRVFSPSSTSRMVRVVGSQVLLLFGINEVYKTLNMVPESQPELWVGSDAIFTDFDKLAPKFQTVNRLRFPNSPVAYE